MEGVQLNQKYKAPFIIFVLAITITYFNGTKVYHHNTPQNTINKYFKLIREHKSDKASSLKKQIINNQDYFIDFIASKAKNEATAPDELIDYIEVAQFLNHNSSLEAILYDILIKDRSSTKEPIHNAPQDQIKVINQMCLNYIYRGLKNDNASSEELFMNLMQNQSHSLRAKAIRLYLKAKPRERMAKQMKLKSFLRPEEHYLLYR